LLCRRRRSCSGCSRLWNLEALLMCGRSSRSRRRIIYSLMQTIEKQFQLQSLLLFKRSGRSRSRTFNCSLLLCRRSSRTRSRSRSRGSRSKFNCSGLLCGRSSGSRSRSRFRSRSKCST
jgi:hypothetical protein